MLIHTKFQIPQVRQTAISRPELMEKLDLGRRCKLTLVSAQAGYGKTTALSEWVKGSNKIVAWISLDSQNNEWIQFWTYILASIQGKTHEFSQDKSKVLEKSSSSNREPLLAFLLNELNRLSHDLYIILDEYHVITSLSIQQAINHLIEHLPPNIHLYIATRSDNIPKARLMAKGELNRITMDDLRFQFVESYALFQAELDLCLEEEQIVTLHEKTEGWISGLQLAVISLKQSNDVMKTIEQINGQQHHIADYLLEEVFQYLPDTVKDFLLETSILTQMNYSLCEKVTGRIDCQEQLEASLLLARLPKQIHSPDYERFMQTVKAEEAHLAIQQQLYEDAREWLNQSGLSHNDEVSLFYMPNQLIFAKALLVCGDDDEIKATLELLGRMNELLEQEGRLRDRIKVVILQSIAYYLLKAVDLSLDRLNHALYLAEPEGYLRTFIDETIWMRNIMRSFNQRHIGKLVHDKYDVSLVYSNIIYEAMQLNSGEEDNVHLTDKEMEVLLLIAEGLSNKEMALRLLITGETVKFHIKNVYRKLKANNRIQAIQQAKIFMIIE